MQENRFLRIVSGGIALGIFTRRLTHRADPAGGAGISPAPAAQATHRVRETGGMPGSPKTGYLKGTIGRFLDDDCTTMAAALAYYTMFSLPPLLLILIAVAGMVLGRQAAQGEIQGQIQGLIGPGAAGEVGSMVQNASKNSGTGLLSAALGIVALLFGATGAFAQLQSSLNTVFHVKPDPQAGGVKQFIGKRILSLGMILAVAFLLLVSLVLSAAMAAVGDSITNLLPSGFSGALLRGLGFTVSFAVVTVLFAAIYRVLPDVHLAWRQVWMGAAITALLFTVGKSLIGMYLGTSAPASAYGAAGSLVLIVLWVYYSAIILLLGAEFTRIWAERHGGAIQPKPGTVRVITREEHAPARRAA